MSKRRTQAAYNLEAVRPEADQASQAPAPSEQPGKKDSFARMAMLLWGCPLIFFIVVAIVKSCE